MMLPDMFLQLVLQMGASMTTPTLNSLATVVKGWLFAGRPTLTGVLVAMAVRRTAPLAMLLYSLTVLWFAKEGHALYQPPFRPWYQHKVRPSFADMLTTLRYACLQAAISANPSGRKGRQNLLLLLPGSLKAAA